MLKSFMEKREGRVTFADRQAALDGWAEVLAATMLLKRSVDELYVPVTDSQCFLTGRDWLTKTGNNSFEVRGGRRPGSFVLLT